MARSMVFLSLPFLLLLLLFTTGGTEAKKYYFEFENDMEGWQSFRGSWHYSSREDLPNPLPDSSGEGFAIMDTKYDSDELYTPFFSVTEGATFSMSFFLRSEWEGSNSMVVQLYKNDSQTIDLVDLSQYSSPTTKEWITVTENIDPSDQDIRLVVFCYNGNAAPAGQLMYGCAVDQIVIDIIGEKTTYIPTTTDSATTTKQSTEAPTEEPTDAPTEEPTDATTEEPTDATTEEPTDATTEEPTDATTEEPTDATTEEPTDATTEEPTDAPTEEPTDATTEEPTDATTEEPTDVPTEEPTDATTEEPTDATTEEPTDVPTEEPTDATTEEPTDATTDSSTEEPTDSPTDEPTDDPTAEPTTISTTEAPQGPLIFDFVHGTQGWTLSNMNGALWQRVIFKDGEFPVPKPPHGPWVLQVFPTDIFASTVLAQSPQLEVLESVMKVEVTFWMDGTHTFPSQLKVRRRQSFDSFDEIPILNLDPYGDQENYNWITFTSYLTGLNVGEVFSLIIEGSLGGSVNNSVAVDRVVLEGVKVIPSDPSEFFDFENGLLGWTQANMDGGQWVLQNWSNSEVSDMIPQPDDGDKFLVAERFDIHSGVIALESPGFAVSPGQKKKVHIKFWVRGSVVYPASLSLRKKSVDGIYDDLPFLSLRPYGDIDNPDWITLDKEYEIPIDSTDTAFQLVIEADLGSGAENMIAVDNIRVITEYNGL